MRHIVSHQNMQFHHNKRAVFSLKFVIVSREKLGENMYKIKNHQPAKTHSSPACGYAAEAGAFCFNFGNPSENQAAPDRHTH